MHLRFLGDALDHWKGSALEWLCGGDLLEELAVDAMTTDACDWSDNDWQTYSRLLRVPDDHLVRHSSSLVSERLQYFAEIPKHADLFLDPDTGIATHGVSRKDRPRYIMPGELLGLLTDNDARVVAVYQHGARGCEMSRRADAVLGCVYGQNACIACASYEATSVAMLFLSLNCHRVAAIADYLGRMLEGRAASRVRLYRP